jgi:drug/metabolite transporter (DMT)-like permease
MQLKVILAALLAVVLWGASPVAAKIAVGDLSPITVAMLRTVLGGLAALLLALAARIPLPRSTRQKQLLVLSAACGFVGFPILFTMGIRLTSANHASMILAALPVFTGAIALTWDRRLPRMLWWVGCAVALTGEFLLISDSTRLPMGDASIAGDTLVLASNFLASLGYVAGARLQQQGYPATGTTFWGVALFALILIPISPLITSPAELVDASFRAWMAIAYLAVGVTIVGYVCWYWALGNGGIERVGLFQFLQPISGVILAWLLLGELIDGIFLAASALILCGVWIALKAK